MSDLLFDGKMPVMITFDVDGESGILSRDPENQKRPVTLSQGAYGPKTGLNRILKLLDKYDIKSTFFVPGWIIDKWRSKIVEIVDRGHEIAHHGWLHERISELETKEQELEILERGIHAIENISGERPAGYRAPGGEFSPNTANLLLEAGFLYSSNMMDQDSPYFLEVDGIKTSLVELPAPWHLEDAPFFVYSHATGRQPYAPSSVLEIWTREFDELSRETGSCMVMILTPQHIGRPHRLGMFEEFIQHIRLHKNTWIARCDEVARKYNEWSSSY